MLCCLNPDCPNPLNPDGINYCQSCGTPLVPLLRGHYRVTNVLSDEGGFGKTYLAEDVDKLNERCVVKQLAPKVQGTWAIKKAIESFQQEAQRLQELGKHQQIPTLLAYFEEAHYLYLVQEFIDGQNLLRELQQRGAYGEIAIRKLLLNLLPVLQFIHEHGVIHRDIKPQNIMRRSPFSPTNLQKRKNLSSLLGTIEGELVLIDFGASKQLSETVKTKPGTTIGTRGYSPLEQMQDGEAHPASDLFSLGATCFHLMTGVSPATLWTENGYSWMTSWRQYLKSPISNGLGKVIDKLLKKAIRERYQSANEVLQDLSSYSLVTPQSSQSFLLQRGLLLSTTILFLGFGGIWYMKDSSLLNPLAESQSSPLKTLNGHSNLVTSVAVSSTSKSAMLASSSFDTTVKLWNLVTKTEIATLEGNAGSVHSVAISPDGQIVASGNGNNTIKLWNPFTKKEIRTLYGHSSSVEVVTISPDSKILASGSFDGTIKLWKLATGEEIATLKEHFSPVKSLAFTFDGQTLASGSEDCTVKLWNLQTQQVIRTLRGHSEPVRSVAISPISPNLNEFGGILATSSADDTIKLWNLSTGEEIYTFKGHKYSVNSVAFSSDGETLASGSSDNTIKLWDIKTKREIRTFKNPSKEVTSVAFSPDRKTLISGSADGSINIWDVTFNHSS
ncbi:MULTISPECIES: serine/threonine-protein kinase [Nostocales]|uniref:Protein kinase n=3 Tax=Nostocales TaxID=1161 RepID=A0A0C1NE34_9CYAN|nr:serine/threonine-protein kinase [Tolypothrix bouteillei]KAF3887994.1 protein kinase [Tolypothrix bouteillei VB521301]